MDNLVTIITARIKKLKGEQFHIEADLELGEDVNVGDRLIIGKDGKLYKIKVADEDIVWRSNEE